MLFALKLRFNGERAYRQFRPLLAQNENEKFYEQIATKLSGVTEKLLPFFYWNDETDNKTVLIKYLRDNMDYLSYSEEGLIERFYSSLHNINELKKRLYVNYISEKCPEVFDQNIISNVKEEIYNSNIPDNVKMYLVDFLMFGEYEIDNFIADLRNVETMCRDLNQMCQPDILRLFEKFTISQVDHLSKMHCVDILKFNTVYVTYCVVLKKTIYAEIHGESFVSILGIDQEDFIDNYDNIAVDFYELGRILYDNTRLKIIAMLSKKEMYCAEIAKELGLKNHSTLYHLNMMEHQQFIVNRPQGKKIYYRINRLYLNSLKKQIDKILSEGEKNGK